MIGRTLDRRAAHANPKSGKYYGPHNIEEYIAKGIHVYMRDPQEGGKPKWLKDTFGNILTPLIRAIDSEWAGTEGDWAVQINVINSAKQSINRHVDEHDIAPQYAIERIMATYEEAQRIANGDRWEHGSRAVWRSLRRSFWILHFNSTRVWLSMRPTNDYDAYISFLGNF